MKKFRWLAILLVISVMFSGCCILTPYFQQAELRPAQPTVPENTEDIVIEPAAQWPDIDLAAECLDGVISSVSAEQAQAFLTEDSRDRAQDLVDFYPDESASVYVRYSTEFEGFDIFYYEIRYESSEDPYDAGYVMLARDEEQYLLCVNTDRQQSLINAHLCSLCGGNGQIWAGSSSVCATCGGTGVWYNPSAWYDSVTNMWMGQTQGCPGCGGSGQLPGQMTITCADCGGSGVMFP